MRFVFSFSIFFGLIISFSFAAGCTAVIVALQHKSSISHTFQKVQKYLGLKQEPKIELVDCDICGIIKCNRHLTAPDREPWRRLFITRELDDALASVSIWKKQRASKGQLNSYIDSTQHIFKIYSSTQKY